MRWIIGLLPAIVWAQVEIVIPDTLPAQLVRWQDIQGDITLHARGAVRILVCLEPEHVQAICTPFVRQPITFIADSLRLRLSAVIADLLMTAEPMYSRIQLPQGRYRLCIGLADVNDSTRTLAPMHCRSVFVRGIPLVDVQGPSGLVNSRETTLLRFRWSTVAPAHYEHIRWELRVVPRRLGQSAWYAFMVNSPHVQCVQQPDNRTWWECTYPTASFEPGKQYVWGIVALSPDGQSECVSPISEFRLVQ